jgi:hypothetical protein
MYYSCYSNTRGVTILPPFKKSCPEIYEGREVCQKTRNSHMDYFFRLNGMKIGLITFLIPGQDHAFCQWEHAVRNHLQGGVNFYDNYSTKRMKEAFEVTCKPKMARIYDNQDIKRCTWFEQGTHQLSYAATNGLETNMVTLVSKKVWHLGRLITARLRLVVATTLHKQLFHSGYISRVIRHPV